MKAVGLTGSAVDNERPGLRRDQAASATRQRDPVATREDIIEVATREFAENGFLGGRVDEIAAKTKTTKRMIYYYFGSKEQLYTTVLERAYATIRAAEQELVVDTADPKAAIRRLVELTLDHHESHPDFIRLVSSENMARAEHMGTEAFADLNSPAVGVIATILESGYANGVFSRRVDPLDLHLMISSFAFFRVSNRFTVEALFGRNMLDPSRRDHYVKMAGDMVVDYLVGASTSGSASALRNVRSK